MEEKYSPYTLALGTPAVVGSWQRLVVFLFLMVVSVAALGVRFGSSRAQNRLLREIWCRMVLSRAL